MVSLAPCSEMETEPCPGEQEKRMVEPNEPVLKKAYTGPGDNESQKEKELSLGLQQEDKEPHGEGDPRIDSQGGGKEGTTLNPLPMSEMTEIPCVVERKLKTPNFAKTVRFSETESVEDRENSEEVLFPDHEIVQWTSSSFEELFLAEDWEDITGMILIQYCHVKVFRNYEILKWLLKQYCPHGKCFVLLFVNC